MSKHQPQPQPDIKPEPSPNPELFMFWPGNDNTQTTDQSNDAILTSQTNDHSISTSDPLSVAVPLVTVDKTSEGVDDKPSMETLSEDRVDHIKKAHDVKTAWTDKDAVYYDSVSSCLDTTKLCIIMLTINLAIIHFTINRSFIVYAMNLRMTLYSVNVHYQYFYYCAYYQALSFCIQ